MYEEIRRQGDKEFREFKTYVCQHRILKKPEEARMAGNVLNSLNSLNSLSTNSKRAAGGILPLHELALDLVDAFKEVLRWLDDVL
jgi:hypothetical protein